MNNYKALSIAINLLLPFFLYAQKDSIPSIKINRTIIFPVITRSIETSWGFGVAASKTFSIDKKDTLSRTSNIQLVGLYTLKKQFIAALEGSQYFKNESYILNEEITFSSFPDKFWGLGKHSPEKAEESYDFKQYYVNLHLLRNIGKNFFVGSIFELQRLIEVDYKKGGIFDQQQVAGRNKYFVAGLGLSLTYDSRNNAFYSNKGVFAQLYFNHFDKYLGSDFAYTNIVLDVRKYITVKKSVLALQAYSFTNLGDEIPLRSLATLGGTNSMRGFYDGRYRDKQQLVVQGEYRMPLYKRFGAVVFGGVGDVGHTITDFSLGDLKYSYGAGLRFAVNKTEKLNIRVDYGFSSKGTSGLYFQLGEAF